jgi:peptide/nickel transport system permease protein
MLRFILRRLLALPFILLLVNFLAFAYANLARWIQASRNPYVAVIRDETPLWQSYTDYLKAALQAGFGEMPNAVGVSILDAILEAGKNSLGLLVIAFGVSLLVGAFLGLRAIRNEPAGVRGWLAPVATVGLALPSFYIGAMLIAFVLYMGLSGLARTSLSMPLYGFGWDAHLIMPVIALSIHPALKLAQSSAILLSGEFNKQYVVTARSQGHGWQRIRTHLALRNVLAPIVLLSASNFRWLIAELIVVEVLFGWPGVGRMLALTLMPPEVVTTSGAAVPLPTYLHPALVATIVTVLAFFFITADIIASILVYVFDPRLRTQQSEAADV